MDTWIPIWTSTVDSTLWEEPLHVRVMFFTLMMIRDPDHVVRDPFRRIVKYAHLSDDLEESVRLAKDALRILGEPDTKSIDSQEYGGRRIKEVEGGWLMLNGEKYEERRKLLSARIRKTQRQKERRELSKASPQVRAAAESREKRFVEAERCGDLAGADRIAAEGLPEEQRENQLSGNTG